MAKRTPYYVAITNDTGVIVQAVEAKIDPIAALLGYTKMATGELPSGKTLAGTGIGDALAAGCIAVNLVYVVDGASGKTQTAKVLVSPTKAGPSLFSTLVSKLYGTKNIVKVRVPRRRVYTY
jgi:hypothetical protein